MAIRSELKRLWRSYKESRATKKLMSSQASSESSNRESKDSMVLDEATAIIVGLGLDMKPEEGFVEYALDDDCDDDDGGDDPRFRKNPYGIGCSRTFEVPYNPIPPAAMRPPVPQGNSIGPRDELLRVWKAKTSDFVKGKGKGRMPGDRTDERYKMVLDGAASRAKSTAN